MNDQVNLSGGAHLSYAIDSEPIEAGPGSPLLGASSESRATKALLLAGGTGVRLRPLTSCRNKHMIPVANQPILFYALGHIARAGIREAGIVLGPHHEEIEAAIGDGHDFGLDVTYINQGDPRGLADAVSCGHEFLGDDPFVMYLGDNLFQEGIAPLLDLYHSEKSDAAIAVTPVADPRHYGVVELDGNRIVSIEEKPPNPRSNLAIVGTYVFSPAVHSIVAELEPSARGELEITDALRTLHQAGHRIVVRRVQGWWKDTGRPPDLLFANSEILRTLPRGAFVTLGRMDSSVQIEGLTSIGDGTLVGGGSRLEGPSVIGGDARISDGARIGPFSAIGDSTRIQRASIERSIVMEGAQISGPVRIEDSVIGRNARITARRPIADAVSLTVGDSSVIEL